MSCPTCKHTMQNLGLAQSGRRTFWCSRCGTIKTEATDRDWVEHEAPRLVARADQLIEALDNKEERRVPNMARAVKESIRGSS